MYAGFVTRDAQFHLDVSSQFKDQADAKEEAEEFDLFAAADLKGNHGGEDQADDRDNDDLFTVTKGMSSAAQPVVSHKRSVFGLDDEDDNKIDELFIPTGALPTDPEVKTLPEEDNSELLR